MLPALAVGPLFSDLVAGGWQAASILADQGLPPVVEHTDHPSGKWVALTFDDGPSPVYTPQVLAILRQYHIRATFCVVGDEVNRHPDLVREVVAGGNRLCDHTMTHDERLPLRSNATIRREILGDLDAIHQAAPGAPVFYYRAPGGHWSPRVRLLAAGWGLENLAWSVDTRDWSRPGERAILDAVHRELRPGGVILMHDGGGDRRQTVAALKVLIPLLIAQGYQFDFPEVVATGP